MALELIKSDRTIQALKPGIKRLNDGGGLYPLLFAKGDSHYRRVLYPGVYPATGLTLAREKAASRLPRAAWGKVSPGALRRLTSLPFAGLAPRSWSAHTVCRLGVHGGPGNHQAKEKLTWRST